MAPWLSRGWGAQGAPHSPPSTLAAALGDSGPATAKSLSSGGLHVLVCKLAPVRAGRPPPGTGARPPAAVWASRGPEQRSQPGCPGLEARGSGGPVRPQWELRGEPSTGEGPSCRAGLGLSFLPACPRKSSPPSHALRTGSCLCFFF